MAKISGPSGWHDRMIETRLVTTAPSSIDESTRSVSAIISKGTPVRRFYGTEILTISGDAIDTARVALANAHCSIAIRVAALPTLLGA